ncbi:MAG: SCO family protein [Nocardioidaceae bacterium]
MLRKPLVEWARNEPASRPRRRHDRRVSKLLAPILVTLALLTACSAQSDSDPGAVANVHENNPDGLHGAVLPEPYQLDSLTLTNSEGKQVAVAGELTKPITLVFFGYTSCPDICQVVMANLTAAVARLGDDAKGKVGMLFITSDPATDDPATLRRYLDHFDPSFEGLTGSLADTKTVAHSLGVAIEKGDKLPSGGYAVAHGTQVLGVLPDGSAPVVWNDSISSKDLAADLTTIVTEGVPTREETR